MEEAMRRALVLVMILGAVACRKEAPGTGAAAAGGSYEKTSVARQAVESQLFQAQDKLGAAAPATVSSNAVTTAVPRMIIRTATLSMIVDDTSAAIEKITSAAESAGGYVSDSKVWRDGEQLRGTVSLRIPATKLNATLAGIRRLGVRIQSESIGSQEVTQEYVDLASQLRNMEAAEAELRQLMATMRQNSKRASEVLEMYQQLVSIRSQIEQTKGRMRYLDDMTALATVNVELVPNALAKPVVEAGWQPLVIVKDASRALVAALQSIASAAIWIGIFVLPVVAMLRVSRRVQATE
jgi:hypothetical protein